MRIVHVAGARPNFMKVAPIIAAFSDFSQVEQLLVHTGQHYDDAMSRVFFGQLGIPRPEIDLGVGSGSHAAQTAGVMLAFEKVCLERRPDLVIVVGDVNSTVACALVAAKLGIKLAHVEAGLRSFDWTMPEEINRVVTDRLADLLFTTERSADENLRREGIPEERVHFVGNVMIDTLLRHRGRAPVRQTLERFGLRAAAYALVTLHRPSNVDSPDSLGVIVDGLDRVAGRMPVLFPAHPRTMKNLRAFGLEERLRRARLIEPLGYLEFLALMSQAAVVITDSGGIQEETTALQVPCVTLRPNTERPITLEQGTNRLVGIDTEAIVSETVIAAEERRNGTRSSRLPDLWDGRASQRIVRIVLQQFGLFSDEEFTPRRNETVS